MELYPWGEEQTKFGYIVIAIMVTVISAAWAQFTGAWVPFVVASIWALWIMWELVIFDYLFGEDILSEEEKAAVAMQEFINDTTGANAARAKKQYEKMMRELNTLKDNNQ